MNNSFITRQILHRVFPIECEMVDSTTLTQLIENRVSFVPPEKGRAMSAHEIFETLTKAVTAISALLNIYNILQSRFGRHPTLTELRAEGSARNAIPEGIEADQRDALERAVLDSQAGNSDSSDLSRSDVADDPPTTEPAP